MPLIATLGSGSSRAFGKTRGAGITNFLALQNSSNRLPYTGIRNSFYDGNTPNSAFQAVIYCYREGTTDYFQPGTNFTDLYSVSSLPANTTGTSTTSPYYIIEGKWPNNQTVTFTRTAANSGGSTNQVVSLLTASNQFVDMQPQWFALYKSNSSMQGSQGETTIHIRYTFNVSVLHRSGTMSNSTWPPTTVSTGSSYFGNSGGQGISSTTHTFTIYSPATAGEVFGGAGGNMPSFRVPTSGSPRDITVRTEFYIAGPSPVYYTWIPVMDAVYPNPLPNLSGVADLGYMYSASQFGYATGDGWGSSVRANLTVGTLLTHNATWRM